MCSTFILTIVGTIKIFVLCVPFDLTVDVFHLVFVYLEVIFNPEMNSFKKAMHFWTCGFSDDGGY